MDGTRNHCLGSTQSQCWFLGAAKYRACSGLHPTMAPLASCKLLGRIVPQTGTVQCWVTPVSLAIPKTNVPPRGLTLGHGLFPEEAGEGESYSCFLPQWLYFKHRGIFIYLTPVLSEGGLQPADPFSWLELMDFTWRKRLNYFHSWFLKVNERPCFRIYIELYISLQEMLSNFFFLILQLLTLLRSAWYLQSSGESPDAAKSPRAVLSVSFLPKKEKRWAVHDEVFSREMSPGSLQVRTAQKKVQNHFVHSQIPDPQNEREVLCKPQCKGTAGCRAGAPYSSKMGAVAKGFHGLTPTRNTLIYYFHVVLMAINYINSF